MAEKDDGEKIKLWIFQWEGKAILKVNELIELAFYIIKSSLSNKIAYESARTIPI